MNLMFEFYVNIGKFMSAIVLDNVNNKKLQTNVLICFN